MVFAVHTEQIITGRVATSYVTLKNIPRNKDYHVHVFFMFWCNVKYPPRFEDIQRKYSPRVPEKGVDLIIHKL